MTSPVDAWLSEYSKEGTRKQHSRNIAEFLEWAKVTPEQLVTSYKQADDKHEYRRKWGQITVQFYNYLIGKGYSINTARLRSASVRSFFTSQADKLIVKRGTIGKAQMSFNEHEFKLEQLQQMYRVADIREKAILSLGVCLGYGATAFVELKREMLENIMAQTEHEKPPIGFWYQRKKTSQPIRSHLTVEAMNALRDYWTTLPDKTEWAFPNGSLQDHISTDGLNYTLQTLVERANIQTMGSVRWHLLRKFFLSALSNVLPELNAKLCTGKSIPSDMLTYLKNKTDVLKEQYANAEKFFVLSGYTNHDYDTIGQLRKRVAQQDENLQKFLDLFTEYLEGKLDKKQATQQAKTIVTEYGRQPTDKEAKEEQLGRQLTDEQYKRVKELRTYEEILAELEAEENDDSS